MLVLTRKTDESVVVGGADGLTRLLKVTVLGISNGKVKLGFEANEDVPVHRSEVWDHLAAQQWGAKAPAKEIPQNSLAANLLHPLNN